VLSYDYTVLAGTQGALGHRKKDRLFELIERMRLPDVFFAEGGGGRPATPTTRRLRARHARLRALGALSGLVPADRGRRRPLLRRQRRDRRLLGPDRRHRERLARHGRPGDDRGRRPGRRRPDEVGPLAMQARNGVVDVVVADEARGGRARKRCSATSRERRRPGRARTRPGCASSSPARQRRAYDVRPIVETLADEGSVTFLRERFAPEMVTRLARIEGGPVGVLANDTPSHGRGDHQRRLRQGGAASCSSATPSACR
jgi:acetyl-CoA carboxylase carboxyltransferase component